MYTHDIIYMYKFLVLIGSLQKMVTNRMQPGLWTWPGRRSCSDQIHAARSQAFVA